MAELRYSGLPSMRGIAAGTRWELRREPIYTRIIIIKKGRLDYVKPPLTGCCSLESYL